MDQPHNTEQGEQGRPGDSSLVLPRIQISSGNFMLLRQLQNEAGRSIHWLESGSVMVTRAGYRPAIAGQIRSDKACLGSQSAGQDMDQQGPWPGTDMVVAEQKTGTSAAPLRQ